MGIPDKDRPIARKGRETEKEKYKKKERVGERERACVREKEKNTDVSLMLDLLSAGRADPG